MDDKYLLMILENYTGKINSTGIYFGIIDYWWFYVIVKGPRWRNTPIDTMLF